MRPIPTADAQAIVNVRDQRGRLPDGCDWYISDTAPLAAFESLVTWDYLFWYADRDQPTVLLVGIAMPELVQLSLFSEVES